MAADFDDSQRRPPVMSSSSLSKKCSNKEDSHRTSYGNSYEDCSNDSDDNSPQIVHNLSKRLAHLNDDNPKPKALTSEALDFASQESDMSSSEFTECPNDGSDPNAMRECVNCSAQKTSQWRTNGSGHYLCNACGLYKKYNGEDRPPASVVISRKKNSTAPKQCSNCGTLTSSMWRRTANKQVACNACGLYYKLYGIQRPIEMRKDVVYPRNRYSKLSINGQPVAEQQNDLTTTDGHKTKRVRRKFKTNIKVEEKETIEEKPIDYTSNVLSYPQTSSLSYASEPIFRFSTASDARLLSFLERDKREVDARKQCAKCGATITRLSIPYFGHYLCDQCLTPPKIYDFEESSSFDKNVKKKSRDIECSNCGVTQSSEWRRNPMGQPVCNACGLYFKLHSKNRPIHMRRDFIAHRKRTTASSAVISSDDNSDSVVINASISSVCDRQTDTNRTADAVISETTDSSVVSSTKKRKQSNPKKLVIPDNYV